MLPPVTFLSPGGGSLNLYIPGTQMTLVLNGVGAFFWRLLSPQNKGYSQVPGIYTYGEGSPKYILIIQKMVK